MAESCPANALHLAKTLIFDGPSRLTEKSPLGNNGKFWSLFGSHQLALAKAGRSLVATKKDPLCVTIPARPKIALFTKAVPAYPLRAAFTESRMSGSMLTAISLCKTGVLSSFNSRSAEALSRPFNSRSKGFTPLTPNLWAALLLGRRQIRILTWSPPNMFLNTRLAKALGSMQSGMLLMLMWLCRLSIRLQRRKNHWPSLRHLLPWQCDASLLVLGFASHEGGLQWSAQRRLMPQKHHRLASVFSGSWLMS